MKLAPSATVSYGVYAMNPPTAEKLQELLSQGRSEHAVALLNRLDPDVAADLVMSIPYDEQQVLFRALPVDFAATLVGHFPYYHSYVLLHSRPAEELRAIIAKTKPEERHEFLMSYRRKPGSI